MIRRLLSRNMVTFEDCVRAAAADGEFVSQWTRLRGFQLGGSPLERAIDEATGFDDHIARTFIADVFDLIWLRVPR